MHIKRQQYFRVYSGTEVKSGIVNTNFIDKIDKTEY